MRHTLFQAIFVVERSVGVNGEASHQTEQGLVSVSHHCHVVSVLIPELPRADSHALSEIRANHSLNEELVPVLADLFRALESMLTAISDLPAPLEYFLFVVLRFLIEDLFDNFIHHFLGIVRSELVLEEWSDLVSALRLLPVFLALTHL